MTVGRAGSTWLINTIAKLDGVATPSSNVDSKDNELIHHQTRPSYEQMAGRKFPRSAELIEYFFQQNQSAPYVGFKSMPRRHLDAPSFLQRTDVQFISLDRRDVAATVASFLAAMKHHTWRRDGGVPAQRLDFESSDRRWLTNNVQYVLTTRLALIDLPGPIALYYEDLCQPGFVSPQLDAYFAQPVPLHGARPATRCSDYVENHEQFTELVASLWRGMCRQLSPAAREKLQAAGALWSADDAWSAG